ncbi:hypothetical protein Hypma_006170 [Hypsizygus marmoreus]|uniref:Uncharacterized protein n=1 Tax=Hypsizygus marmoreus TaxID=39966 RepID=A0A369JWC6_HYPMA|nr:hypothetical protein Hypma_006170 [Hypsizygus marmoreus]
MSLSTEAEPSQDIREMRPCRDIPTRYRLAHELGPPHQAIYRYPSASPSQAERDASSSVHAESSLRLSAVDIPPNRQRSPTPPATTQGLWEPSPSISFPAHGFVPTTLSRNDPGIVAGYLPLEMVYDPTTGVAHLARDLPAGWEPEYEETYEDEAERPFEVVAYGDYYEFVDEEYDSDEKYGNPIQRVRVESQACSSDEDSSDKENRDPRPAFRAPEAGRCWQCGRVLADLSTDSDYDARYCISETHFAHYGTSESSSDCAGSSNAECRSVHCDLCIDSSTDSDERSCTGETQSAHHGTGTSYTESSSGRTGSSDTESSSSDGEPVVMANGKPRSVVRKWAKGCSVNGATEYQLKHERREPSDPLSDGSLADDESEDDSDDSDYFSDYQPVVVRTRGLWK